MQGACNAFQLGMQGARNAFQRGMQGEMHFREECRVQCIQREINGALPFSNE
jgi:hypothetical protein